MPRNYTVQTHAKEIKLNKKRKALISQNQNENFDKEDVKAQEESQQKLKKRKFCMFKQLIL